MARFVPDYGNLNRENPDYCIDIMNPSIDIELKNKVVIAGMAQALTSVKNIELHLASIAQSLSIIAAAQAKLEEK